MKKLTSEEVNKVLEGYWWFGKNSNQVAAAAGVSQQTASGIIKAFKLMRVGDIQGLVQEAAGNEKISVQIVNLVSERMGVDAPEEVVLAIQERAKLKAEKYKNRREATKMKITAEIVPEEAPVPHEVKVQEMAEPKGNDALYFIRILEEMHEQNQLLRDLLDVVIPKWAGDMKDNANANSDVLAGLLREQGQALDTIRCNTRKRGL